MAFHFDYFCFFVQVKNEATHFELEDFILEMTQLPQSDVLVHLSEEKCVFLAEKPQSTFTLSLDKKTTKLIRKATEIQKNSDVQSLSLAAYAFQWTWNNQAVETPLFLFPLEFKEHKLNQEIQFSQIGDSFLFNPFLKRIWKRDFDFDFDFQFSDENSAEANLFFALEQFEQFCLERQIYGKIEEKWTLSNFHHHRFLLLKELELIQEAEKQSDLLRLFLGETLEMDRPIFDFSTEILVDSDPDQTVVLEKLRNQNLLLQGPPGTGKSQVLTNILGKSMDSSIKTLVVSEKKVALDVLVKKLQHVNLNAFAFVFHSRISSNDFLKHLKKTWFELEKEPENLHVNLRLSEQKKAQLQLTLDRLQRSDLIGGVSWSEFKNLLKNRDLENIPFIPDLPSISEWKTHETKVLQNWPNTSEQEILQHLHLSFFERVDKLSPSLTSLVEQLKKLADLADFSSWRELEIRIRQSARLQLLENEKNKRSFSLCFPKSKADVSKQKKYTKLRSLFFELELKSAEMMQLQLPFVVVVNRQFCEEFIQVLQSNASSWKKRKWKRKMEKTLSFPIEDWELSLKNHLLYLDFEREKSKVLQALLELGIEDPTREIPQIDYLIQQFNSLDETEFSELEQLSTELKQNLLRTQKELNEIQTQIKLFFAYSETLPLVESFEKLNRIQVELIRKKTFFSALPRTFFRVFEHANSPDEALDLICKSNWVWFLSNFPTLADFKGEKLHHLLQEIDFEIDAEQVSFAAKIRRDRSLKFQEYHQLLSTPKSKLSDDEYQLKRQLKLGKSILVREFAKTKRHLSLREFMQNEARIWIDLLCPVILCTPHVLAQLFSTKAEQFDLVVFDEASQIPLPHAIGALQRGKAVLVAGDEQQMAPASFFTRSSSSPDLMHQARFYLESLTLSHHYRSENPALIAFSNRHFYGGKLKAFPAFPYIENPLKLHFVSHGVFKDRQNIPEAKEVASFIEKNVTTSKNLGIVAFSEQQLGCIYQQLSPKTQEFLESKIEMGSCFFKSLENVQGDECEVLIISLGYGPTELGDFHLRFGPLNQENGSKRLNVLFSRAQSEIHFFTSVRSPNFKLSNNEAVNLLRSYLEMLENPKTAEAISFPWGLRPTISRNVLTFNGIEEHIQDASELHHIYRSLVKRAWKVKFE